MGKGCRSRGTCLWCHHSMILDSGMMLWLVKCLHVDRCAVLLTVSHSFNITLLVRKVFLKPRFWATNSNFFGRIFTYPSAPRVFISLCQSWCYSSCWSELSRSVCLHSYFVLNSNNKLTLTWVMRTWRVDISTKLIAGGWINGIKGMYPGSSTLSPPPGYLLQLTSLTDYFFHLPGFFLLFSQCGAWSRAIRDEQYKIRSHSTGYVYAWVD